MVATDGHRLSMVERMIPNIKKGVFPKGIILPRKGASELRRMLTDAEKEVEVAMIERQLVVRKDDQLMMIRLIDGEFPNYKQVIPKGNDKKIVVSKNALYRSLKRVSLLSQEMSRGVKIAISGATMVISTNNPMVGEAREEIEIRYEGPEMSIGFNAKYFQDVLQVVDSEDVRLELNNELAPGVLIPVDEENFRAVIMPMRL